MADGLDRKNKRLVGVLIGAAVVALAVLAYFYYQRSREPVVKIDVPGFRARSARTTAASTSRSARTQALALQYQSLPRRL